MGQVDELATSFKLEPRNETRRRPRAKVWLCKVNTLIISLIGISSLHVLKPSGYFASLRFSIKKFYFLAIEFIYVSRKYLRKIVTFALVEH
jgi:hypothetical protein